MGHPCGLRAGLQHRRHPLQQCPVVIKPVWAAQLELDAGGRQLLPPALQPLLHSLHRSKAKGDARGHSAVAIQAEQPPDRLLQQLTPPIPERQIHSTSCWWRQAAQQFITNAPVGRINPVEVGQQALEFSLDGLQPIGAVTCIQTTGFPPGDDPVMIKAQFKPFHRRGGATADGQRNRLGERKPTQSPAHPTCAPNFKVTQDLCEPH